MQWTTLVHAGNGNFTRLPTPIVFPMEMVAPALQREVAYCIIDASPGTSRSRALLVAPGGRTDPTIRLIDGRLVAENGSAPSVPEDPMELGPGSGDAVLGSLMATLYLAPE
jgi:hypothetical protein